MGADIPALGSGRSASGTAVSTVSMIASQTFSSQNNGLVGESWLMP